MKKKFFTQVTAVILGLLMIFASMPIIKVSSVQVELSNVSDVYTSINYNYILTEKGTAEIIGYTGTSSVIEIPSSIDGHTVVKIARYDNYDTTNFSDCTSIVSVTIPKSVESVSWGAFAGCTNLETINVLGKTTNIAGNAFDGTKWYENQPEGVIYIGNTVYGYKGNTEIGELVIKDGIEVICDYAFQYCYAFSNIVLPESVNVIGKYAFANSGIEQTDFLPSNITSIPQSMFEYCSRLVEVNIPDGIESIEYDAFSNCENLKTVIIPSTVTDLDLGAFNKCKKLSEINVDKENSFYSSENGALLDKEKTTLIMCPQGKLGGYIIPDSVVSIGTYYRSAFLNCANITSITIGDNLSSWGNYFLELENLENIYVSEGNDTFESVDGVLFYKDSPTLVYCPSGKNGNYSIPLGTEKLVEWAFRDSKLSSVEIPASVKTFGYGVFLDSINLESVIVKEGVEIIGDGAFSGCRQLKDISLPSTLKTISYNAFYNCSSIESIEIPEGVETIDTQAFMDCTSLLEINVPENLKTLGSGVFMGTAWYENQPDGVIYIGDFLYEYKGEMPADTNIEIKDGTVEIIKWAFSGQDNLIGITIPNSVTRIGDGAFIECNGLEKVTIPSSIQNLDDEDYRYGIFSFCTSLESVIIEEGSTSIADTMFLGCPNLKKVVIPDSVKTIGSFAFNECISLKDISIPDGVESIGASAFDNTAWYNNQDDGVVYLNTFVYGYKGEMPENEKIIFNDNTTGISEFAFNHCINLTSVVFPFGVKYIGEAAFQGCDNLKTITIPSSVISIKEFAFNVFDENSNTDIYYMGTPEEWNSIVIGKSNGMLTNNSIHFVVEHQDEKSGIIIVASEDLTINIKKIPNTNENNNANIVLLDGTIVEIYDITLTKNNIEVQPNCTVTVKIPTDNESSKVYRKETDGTLTDMYAVYNDGYMVFTTDHFSIYVLAEVKEAETTPSTSPSVPETSTTPSESGFVLGDVNGDGKVNIKDATQIQKFAAKLVELTEDESLRADVNSDSKVNVKDATVIQKYVAKLETGFLVGEPLVLKENN